MIVVEIPYSIDEPCPNCGDNSEVWAFPEREGAELKEYYTCDTCGYEWTEIH